MDAAPAAAPIAGWTVLCLRPADEASGLRRLLARHGARLHCLAPWRIEALPAASALATALRASDGLIATSPNAVRAAAALVRLGEFRGAAFAVGSGSARALRRAGLARVEAPDAMHSEGLLALPGLRAIREVALLTGEGGRNLIAPALAQRGVRAHRIDLYRRVLRPIPAAAADRVAAMPPPAALLLSSAEALQHVAATPAMCRALQGLLPVYASERLRAAGEALGLDSGVLAASARAADLVAALCRHAKPAPFR
jgi:uroporphyrinogen-III synthase